MICCPESRISILGHFGLTTYSIPYGYSEIHTLCNRLKIQNILLNKNFINEMK